MIFGKSSTLTSSAPVTPSSRTTSSVSAISFWQLAQPEPRISSFTCLSFSLWSRGVALRRLLRGGRAGAVGVAGDRRGAAQALDVVQEALEIAVEALPVDGVVGTRALAAHAHQAGVAQQGEMVRDERLALVERPRHLADAALAAQQALDDLGARRVAERLEERDEVDDAAGVCGVFYDLHVSSSVGRRRPRRRRRSLPPARIRRSCPSTCGPSTGTRLSLIHIS